MANRELTPTAILRTLREREALLQGHFALSSGLHSGEYLQCAVALQDPVLATALGEALAARVAAMLPLAPEVVVAPALGGIVIGQEVGRALRVNAMFAERVDHGMCLRRGFRLRPGERALIVEDVVTTGGSSSEAMVAVQRAGGVPIGVACIADRGSLDELQAVPLIHLIRLQIDAWDPGACPLCVSGEPLNKPGSRV